ncbi:ABC transporter permease [Jiangella alkaliphila]|uniref:Oligopeptide transport system permease protein n=1 Tax=Jiangella alkaliphila TaxID=419479 RepID=A0A1H2JCB4_9ACTN|nr:ABC transporter permease [Jiangella alkaliphila]SDU54039.1 oligopeptide transport system permease protein [Jiangella alkaliphila]
MTRYVVQRLGQMVPVVIGTTFLIYALVWALPGDPFAAKCGDRPCPANYVARMTAEYNLDDPLPLAYLQYMGKLLTGDFGETFAGVSIADELLQRYPITLQLTLLAILVEVVIGIAAGVLAGIRRGGFLDNLVLVSTLVVVSIPVFVLGLLAQVMFGVRLGWFPVTSDGSLYSLVLPAIVLGSLSLAFVARLVRANLVENLRTDYVRTAIAKGLTRQRVIGVHTLRNSLIPVVTFVGADFGGLLGGAVVVEGIFNIPGVGNMIFRGINAHEGATVTAAVTVLVLVFLLVNLLVDLLYAVLDPRIRHV